MSIHPANEEHPTWSWQDRLDSAASEADVVAAAREFLAQFNPQEIYSLPPPCRPEKLVDASDVTSYAFVLVRHGSCLEAQPAALLQKIAAFFSNASTRLSEIMARSGATA